MAGMATVLLIRHGRSTANTDGVLAGWTPGVELDERGQEQVRLLAERLTDVPLTLAVSSPLIRCLQTTDALLAGRDVTRREDERLGECRYGSWTGRKLAELASEPLWRTVQTQPSAARFPDGDHPGESLPEMAARATAAVRAIDDEVTHAHGPHAVWAAVSHGDVIKAILADAAGCPLDLFQRWHVDPASLSVVRYTTERPYVLRVNDTGSSWLPPAPPQDDGTGENPPESDAIVGGGTGD